MTWKPQIKLENNFSVQLMKKKNNSQKRFEEGEWSNLSSDECETNQNI